MKNMNNPLGIVTGDTVQIKTEKQAWPGMARKLFVSNIRKTETEAQFVDCFVLNDANERTSETVIGHYAWEFEKI